ncbi:RNA exonuclease 5 [Tachypleus tridentatus]|uniref:RNA exonuclease 5 n=1 Tax=Tachypleus tridentatus TaxID=6853 RepID=UPI003FCFE4B9
MLSLKKRKRIESKKRKIKAFLEIANANEDDKQAFQKAKKSKLSWLGLPQRTGKSTVGLKSDLVEDSDSDSESSTVGDTGKEESLVLKNVAVEGDKIQYLNSECNNLQFFDENIAKEKLLNDTFKGINIKSHVTMKQNCITVSHVGENNKSSELQNLRAKLREQKKRKMQRPLFYLTDIGFDAWLKSEINSNGEYSFLKPSYKLFAQDIQHLLLVSLMGRETPYNTRWCRLLRWQKTSHVIVLIVDNVSVDDFCNNVKCFPNMCKLFKYALEFLSPKLYGRNLIEELSQVPLTMSGRRKLLEKFGNVKSLTSSVYAHKALSTIFPIMLPEKANKEAEKNETCAECCSRIDLLLSPVQLIIENFPLPVIDKDEPSDYCFTKKEYLEVSPHSPLFALDCEMCMTTEKKLELTRVSIVNEHLEVVYDSLVKPHNKIINYLTKYSGITKSMLDPVTTRLEDVQKDIQYLLPSDAILCGHSLNCDLEALKMIHPYVIDTSVIYNISGKRLVKPSLKMLSYLFIGEKIQMGDGHSSVEDSSATMKLVLLKLKNDLHFGDVILGGTIPIGNNLIKEKNPSDINHIGSVTSLFKHATERGKSVCVIGETNVIEQYPAGVLDTNVRTIKVTKVKKVSKKLKDEAINHDFTFGHFDFQCDWQNAGFQDMLKNVDKYVSKVHRACADRALFVVMLSGCAKIEGNGVCFVTIKDMNQ